MSVCGRVEVWGGGNVGMWCGSVGVWGCVEVWGGGEGRVWERWERERCGGGSGRGVRVSGCPGVRGVRGWGWERYRFQQLSRKYAGKVHTSPAFFEPTHAQGLFEGRLLGRSSSVVVAKAPRDSA